MPWVAAAMASNWRGAEFRVVDIRELLAYQHTIDLARAGQHCGHVSHPPTEDEIFQVCMPTALETVTPQVLQAPGSLLLKARSGNLRIMGWGRYTDQGGNNVLGIAVGVAPTFVHVVRFDGRCYLHNGFHRTVALMRAGATQIACVFRDVPDAVSAGIKEDGGTFRLAQLAGANPPTLAHYADGRAYAVTLRGTSRIINVS